MQARIRLMVDDDGTPCLAIMIGVDGVLKLIQNSLGMQASFLGPMIRSVVENLKDQVIDGMRGTRKGGRR